MILQIFIIGHLFADFFLQSSNLSIKKEKSIRFVLLHSFIYLAVFSTISFLLLNWKYALFNTLIISASHLIMDYIKSLIERKIKNGKLQFYLFLYDQIIHLSIITVLFYLLSLSNHTNYVYSQIISYSKIQNIVLYFLLYSILICPTAIFIKKLFGYIIKKEEPTKISKVNVKNISQTITDKYVSDERNIVNAGNLIGILERILVSILILIGQYGVIGLVLTAKSIARFKQLENKDFAEKYLIGTLVSISISIIVTLIIKSLLQ